MALDKEKIEEVLQKLPSELRDEVRRLVESLLQRERVEETNHLAVNGTTSVRVVFWFVG